MNKAIAFILGLVLGGVFFLGAIGMAAYAGLVMVHPEDVLPNSKTYIGDLAGMSIYDMFVAISDLYKTKLGVTGEDGKYYTIGEFCQTYNIDTEAAFGIKLEGDVADIPMMEFLSKEANADGENGFQRTLKQIKLSAVTAVVNMFGGKDEDGNPKEVVSESAVAKLNKRSLYDLIVDESVGIAGCFADVEFAEVMPSAFPSDDSTDNKLMYALGKTKIGKMLEGLSGDNSLFLLMKTGGALETLGNLSFTDILGDESKLITSLLGGRTINSLISDAGNIVPDELLNDIKLGNVLSLTYNEESGVWEDADGKPADGFFATIADLTINQVRDTNLLSSFDLGGLFGFVKNPVGDIGTTETPLAASQTDNTTVAYLRQEGGKYALCSASDFENDKAKWYEAKPVCDNSHDSHTAECFEYVWYAPACENDAHTSESDHVAAGEVLIDGSYHGKPTGIFAAFIGITLGDLTSGNSDKIMAKIGNMKIGDLLTTIPPMLNSLADVPVSKIADELGKVHIGSLLEYERAEFVGDKTKTTTVADGILSITFGTTTTILKADGDKLYVATLNCKNDAHDATHTADCYTFVWYKTCAAGCSETHDHFATGTDYKFATDGLHTATDGIEGILSDKTINDLSDLNDILAGDVTLGSVLGDNLPQMLAPLADVTIANMGDAVNKLYLGGILGLYRQDVDQSTIIDTLDGGKIIRTADGYAVKEGKKYYLAELTCTDTTHTHTVECFAYVWFTKCQEGTHEGGATHTVQGEQCQLRTIDSTQDYFYRTSGITGKLAAKTVGGLTDISDLINTATLYDVLGDNVPSMLKSIADTKIGELETAINGVAIGELLGNKQQDGVWYEKCTRTDHSACVGEIEIEGVKYVPASGILSKLSPLTVGELNSDKIQSVLSDVTLGEVIDIDSTSNKLLQKLAGKKIGELSGEFDNLTLGDVLDTEAAGTNGLIKELATCKISEIGTRINDVKVGAALGYTRTEASEGVTFTQIGTTTAYAGSDGKTYVLEGGKYYLAELTCTATAHTHTDECYAAVWTNSDGSATSGVNKIIADMTVTELSDNAKLKTQINKLTLADVMDNTADNCILNALADKPIGELASSMNEMSMGIVLGYTKDGAVWKDSAGNQVKGINAKIADKTLANISSGNGVNDIMTTLTMGDLVDSGVLTISTDDTYKMAIIANGWTEDYLVAKYATGATVTPQSFYLTKDPEQTKLDNWKLMNVNDLIQNMLNSFNQS